MRVGMWRSGGRMLRRATSRASFFLVVVFLKAILALARHVPALARDLQAIASKRTFRYLTNARNSARIASLIELPSDAAFFVAHERKSTIWLYPCETEREAAVYVAMARKRNEAAKVYRGIPARLDAGRSWMYFPGLVAPSQTITPRREAWIEALRSREAQKLRIQLHVPD